MNNSWTFMTFLYSGLVDEKFYLFFNTIYILCEKLT